jgi:hypothetical protein
MRVAGTSGDAARTDWQRCVGTTAGMPVLV